MLVVRRAAITTRPYLGVVSTSSRPTAGLLPLELWLDAKFTAALAGATGGGKIVSSASAGLPIVVTYAHPALMPHLHKVAAAAAATTTSIDSGEAEEMYYDNSEQQ